MKVIKIGGGCLNGKKTIARIIDLIVEKGKGNILVVSALNGVTDLLVQSISSALENEENVPKIISRLKAKHMIVARYLIKQNSALKEFEHDLGRALNKLERLYYGLNFTKENTPRIQDVINSYGERLSALLMSGILRSRKIQSRYRMPHKIGLITDGKYGDATADLTKTTKNFKKLLIPFLKKNMVLFIPGFFGVNQSGDITTFGRGGSDYSAAVIAVATQASILEIWKDVDGFMSADPKCVPGARLIKVLSYEEAAELAYFGATILHPRTIEPVRIKKLDITIKNTLNPYSKGTLITARSSRVKSIIKSVAHDTDLGVLKVHASGVGARPGILALVASQITQSGLNIKSVVTSQTCISLLLAQEDLTPGYQAIKSIKPKPYRKIEILKDVALISIVGEGLLQNKGIAARCFSAVAENSVNVEMISFGPSRAALYFLTKQKDVNKAVNAIHNTFFSNKSGTI